MFTFCPHCKHKLEQQGIKVSCAHCSFEFYFNPKPCNSVVIINTQGQVLLTQRGRAPKKGYWDLPGGFMDQAETAEASAVREIYEELGVKLHNARYIGSYPDRYVYKGINYHTLGFAFTGSIGKQVPQAADDVVAVQWFSPKDIPWQRIAFASVQQALHDVLTKKKFPKN